MNTLDKVYDLTIDIKNIDVKYNSYAKFFDDDRETSVIRIKLLNDKTPMNLENCIVEAYFILADNTYHNEACKIINSSEGVVELQLCQKCLVKGENIVRLSILKDNEISNTPVITYEVRKGLYSDNPSFNDDPLTPILSQMLLDIKVTKVNQIELQERYEKSLPKIEGKIKEVESLINRVDTAIASGTQDLEVKEARVDKNGKSYAKLGDRLDEVDSQLEHSIKKINNIVYYNICDYEGETLNQKWDNLRLEFRSFQPKEVLIPIPRADQEGAILTPNGWKWCIDAPIVFDDNCNCSKILIHDEIVSKTNIESAVIFDDTNKPEDIDFPYGIRIRGNSLDNKSIGVGLDIRAGARINFNGQVLINDCNTGVIVGGEQQSAPCSVSFDKLSIGFPSECGVMAFGKTHDVFINADEIIVQIFQNSDKNAIELCGKIRNSRINYIQYSTDTPKNGYLSYDCENVVRIYSKGDYEPREIVVGEIYGYNAGCGLKIDNPFSGSIRVKNIMVNKIKTTLSEGTSNAYDIDYCSNITINSIGEYNTAIVGVNTSGIRQTNISSSKAITDNSKKMAINNIVARNDSVFTVPNTAYGFVGNIFANIHSNGNRLYIKYQETGDTTKDIMQIDSQMFIPNVEALPMADWTLRGKMFMVNNNDANGTDTIYICKRKKGVYVWVEIAI